MWLLNWLPYWVFYLILIAGLLGIVASYVLKAIPFVRAHAMGIQVAGILLTVLGVWFAGGIAKDREYKERIADLQLQVAKAEKAAAEANAQIEYVYVDRIKVVEKIKYQVVSSIRENSSELDANCKISPKAVEILNQSAEALNQAAKK
jgi:hypothetical protein